MEKGPEAKDKPPHHRSWGILLGRKLEVIRRSELMGHLALCLQRTSVIWSRSRGAQGGGSVNSRGPQSCRWGRCMEVVDSRLRGGERLQCPDGLPRAESVPLVDTGRSSCPR